MASKKKSKVDQNIIKRIQKYRDLDEEDKLIQTRKEVHEKSKVVPTYDLWDGDNGQNKTVIAYPSMSNKDDKIKYPNVPLPHPGQSYNPSAKDLKNLLSKVIDSHKPHYKDESQVEKSNLVLNKFEESDEDSEVDPNEPISNNPAVNPDDRFTKTKRNKMKKKRENRMVNDELRKKKELKKEIFSVKENKKFAEEKAKTDKKIKAEELKKKNE